MVHATRIPIKNQNGLHDIRIHQHFNFSNVKWFWFFFNSTNSDWTKIRWVTISLSDEIIIIFFDKILFLDFSQKMFLFLTKYFSPLKILRSIVGVKAGAILLYLSAAKRKQPLDKCEDRFGKELVTCKFTCNV